MDVVTANGSAVGGTVGDAEPDGAVVGGVVLGRGVVGGGVVPGVVVEGLVVDGLVVVGLFVVGGGVLLGRCEVGGLEVTGGRVVEGGFVVTSPVGPCVWVCPPPYRWTGPFPSVSATARPAFRIIPIPTGTEIISAARLTFSDRSFFGVNMRYPPPAMCDDSFYHVRPKLSQGLFEVIRRKWQWSDLEKRRDLGESRCRAGLETVGRASWSEPDTSW
ncbi:hypothetical protein OG948_11800 [Embleya sp. NBC_00888]|uniref:hypothetical protein n=1 Tax=Embleya sp. NBC_00888 TaxID=2975960 RepID=UPI003862E741|nr:hypothetical protein OG948_11800 [Embleya sp. NBC_00888]